MRLYDLAINWNSKDDCFFARKIRSICREKSISFLWIYDGNLKKVFNELSRGRIKIQVLLDTDATYEDPEDIYAKLCYVVKDQGGIVVNDPDRTQYAIDKSRMYYEVKYAGMHTPETVILRRWRPMSFVPEKKHLQKIGEPFLIKPGLGYAQKGIIRFASGTSYFLKKARKFDISDNYLLQKRVDPLELGGNKAWFRVFYVFGDVILCWWDDKNNLYKHVSFRDFKKFRLKDLVSMAVKLHDITGMSWFSSEIAIIKENGKKIFTIIDYVNDQCDMTPDSEAPNGVPENIVIHTAERVMSGILSLLSPDKLKPKKSSYVFLGPDKMLKMVGNR